MSFSAAALASSSPLKKKKYFFLLLDVFQWHVLENLFSLEISMDIQDNNNTQNLRPKDLPKCVQGKMTSRLCSDSNQADFAAALLSEFAF